MTTTHTQPAPLRAAYRFAWLAALALLGACGGGGDIAAAPPSAEPTSVPATPLGLSIAVAGAKTLRLSWNTAAGATEYRVQESADGVSPFAQVASLPAGSVQHDLQLFLPERLNARYRVSACNSLGCADATPVAVDAALLNQAIGYFKPSNAVIHFGHALTLSGDGLTLAVGTIYDASGATGINNGNPHDTSAPLSGSVHVFHRGAAGWVQQAYIKASNAEANNRFGNAVALSTNGNLLAVGAPGANSSTHYSGAVYLFERSAGQWTQTAEVKPPNTGRYQEFGVSLALARDDQTLAVGAPGDASGINGNPFDESLPDSGAVHVFQRGESGWAAQAYIKASTAWGDRFGSSTAISTDGNTLVAGAPFDDNRAPNAGAAYVFTRNGAAWSPQAYLKASNPDREDRFGASVAVSGDGQTIAVGAAFEDSAARGIDGDQGNHFRTGGRESGAVYVFALAGSAWSQQAYVKPSNTGAFDRFGQAVSLAADGHTLAVGASQESSGSAGLGGNGGDDSKGAAGAVYLFRREGTSWGEASYLKASNPDRQDTFGDAVVLADDGRTLAVSATEESSAATGVDGNQSDNSASARGAIYLY
jgi:hypothetical protein